MSNYLMIVDDDPINNIITKKRFSMAIDEVQIQIFEWASEALTHLENTDNLPDLVLLDLNMPAITGWDFLDKCNAKNIAVNIVILTSSIDERDIKKSKNYSNVKAFISKPLNQGKVDKIASLI